MILLGLLFGGLGLWATLLLWLFIIAMVIGCTFDRHYAESPKWWILTVAVVTWICYSWYRGISWSDMWSMFWSREVWQPVAIYLLIGVAYSILEFLLDVRRSARYWSTTWKDFKKKSLEQTERLNEMRKNFIREKEKEAREKEFKRNPGDFVDAAPPAPINEGRRQRPLIHPLHPLAFAGENAQEADTPIVDMTTPEYNSSITKDFLSRYSNEQTYRYRIIGVEKNAEGNIEPKINRQQLAESVGCWTIFWPFYAISLIIGDLVTELFRILADILANISGRFVRSAFRDVFKF